MKATVFLGGGRITSALIAGLRLAGYDRPLVVHDRNPGKLRDLKRRYEVEVQSKIEKAVVEADRIIVAVRPDSVRELLGELQGLEVPAIGISLAAGVPLSQLKQLVPSMRWARAMPSPVLAVATDSLLLFLNRNFRSGSGKRSNSSSARPES